MYHQSDGKHQPSFDIDAIVNYDFLQKLAFFNIKIK